MLESLFKKWRHLQKHVSKITEIIKKNKNCYELIGWPF
jgi:hypothetical protein